MTLDLNTLNAQVPIVDAKGNPSFQFQQLWQKSIEAIEASVADISDQLAAIQAARREDARTASYPSPSNVLSAADVGADATITVASHTRVYPGSDIDDVAITGGDITGLAFSTLYYVYYDDPTLEDTTPTFLATTTAATGQVGAAAGRHSLGSITTPANGAGGTSGGGYHPPGGEIIP